jgi:predicted nucleotidyltransferase
MVLERRSPMAAAAFDHPARYQVRHGDVSEVVSFTPTYAGQAASGEND